MSQSANRVCVLVHREIARHQDHLFRTIALGVLAHYLMVFLLQQSTQAWMITAALVATVIKSSIQDRLTAKAAHTTLHAGKGKLYSLYPPDHHTRTDANAFD